MYLACAFVGVSLFLVRCCVAMLCLGGGWWCGGVLLCCVMFGVGSLFKLALGGCLAKVARDE